VSVAAGVIVLAGRILFAIFFGPVAGGMGHIQRSGMMEETARSARFPVPSIAGWPTGVWLILGSVSIAFGIWPDIGALMVAAFLLTAAVFFHPFWRIEDPMQKLMQTQLFWRNMIGIAACLVMFGTFAALGPALRFAITGPLFTF
jgi:putative oxidoreductase